MDDTGTNMTLTITSAAKEVRASLEIPGNGAFVQGNFLRILKRRPRKLRRYPVPAVCVASPRESKKHDEIDAPLLAEAFEKAVETAYKAVMKPKEGTILTVARGMAEKASELATEGMELEEY